MATPEQIQRKEISELRDSVSDINADRNIAVGNYYFRSRIYLIEEILYMIDSGKLRICDFSGPCCKNLMKFAIENVLLDMPVTQILIDGSSDTWYLIGGELEVKAWRSFFIGDLIIDNSYIFNAPYKNQPFGKLQGSLRRKFLNTKIVVNILNPGANPIQRLRLLDFELKSHNISRERRIMAFDEYGALVFPVASDKIRSFAESNGIIKKSDVFRLADILIIYAYICYPGDSSSQSQPANEEKQSLINEPFDAETMFFSSMSLAGRMTDIIEKYQLWFEARVIAELARSGIKSNLALAIALNFMHDGLEPDIDRIQTFLKYKVNPREESRMTFGMIMKRAKSYSKELRESGGYSDKGDNAQ